MNRIGKLKLRIENAKGVYKMNSSMSRNTALQMVTLSVERDSDISVSETGADVNWANKLGATACMLASLSGQQVCLDRLISAGADVNARDKEGRTAAHFAVFGGNHKCLRSLMAAGATFNTSNGSTAVPCYI